MAIATVRPARSEDREALERMLPPFLRTPYKHGRFLRALANGEVSVAECEHEIAGFIWLTELFGHTFVNVLAVDETHRRKGYAGVLLSFAERERSTDRVFASTNRSNDAMHAVLARYGWRRCGEVDEIDPGDPEIVYVRYPA